MFDRSLKLTQSGAHPEVISAEKFDAGIGFTVTVCVVVVVHPFASVTVAVYVVVVKGVTEGFEPASAPGFHTTVYGPVPPPGVTPRFVPVPLHTPTEAAATAVSCGAEAMTKVTVVRQDIASVIVQVYVPPQRPVAPAAFPPEGVQA